MLIILNSETPFLALILSMLCHFYLTPSTSLSTPGVLLIDSLNPKKTEYLLIGTRPQRSKITHSLLSFHGTALIPVSSARNLGVDFQSDFSFNQHISNVSRSFYYHIRQLRQTRLSLHRNSSIQLANAPVSSKLHYCNK